MQSASLHFKYLAYLVIPPSLAMQFASLAFQMLGIEVPYSLGPLSYLLLSSVPTQFFLRARQRRALSLYKVEDNYKKPNPNANKREVATPEHSKKLPHFWKTKAYSLSWWYGLQRWLTPTLKLIPNATSNVARSIAP
jgi:hypothetical protein